MLQVLPCFKLLNYETLTITWLLLWLNFLKQNKITTWCMHALYVLTTKELPKNPLDLRVSARWLRHKEYDTPYNSYYGKTIRTYETWLVYLQKRHTPRTFCASTSLESNHPLPFIYKNGTHVIRVTWTTPNREYKCRLNNTYTPSHFSRMRKARVNDTRGATVVLWLVWIKSHHPSYN